MSFGNVCRGGWQKVSFCWAYRCCHAICIRFCHSTNLCLMCPYYPQANPLSTGIDCDSIYGHYLPVLFLVFATTGGGKCHFMHISYLGSRKSIFDALRWHKDYGRSPPPLRTMCWQRQNKYDTAQIIKMEDTGLCFAGQILFLC